MLRPANGNFRSMAVASPITSTAGTTTTAATLLTTSQQIALLSNALQALAMTSPRALTATATSTPTADVASTITPGATLLPTVTPTTTLAATPSITTTQALTSTGIPLLIGLEWDGNDNPIFAGGNGFSPLATAMAMGATWTPSLTEAAGQMLGRELQAVGVNLLLGPPLDVLDTPRPGSKGDLATRAFGGDPYWVGQMGQAFIRGVQEGSKGTVQTAAKHFPGQGSSDRQPEDEVATVQKSVQQLRQIELAPFATVTAAAPGVPGATAALITSHIRYRGFQGNIRQLTPPISLAPQLQDLMALKEFADWRAAGGVLISDALGVPAVRRYYDPQLQKFPHRQVAQDAFLAGNDLLYLARFAVDDAWPNQMANIKETIVYFQNKYVDDHEFRGRVDASVARILQLKLRIFGPDWQLDALQRPLDGLAAVGQGTTVAQTIARAGLTLIYPSRDELADRMPSAPLADENILIFTDARLERDPCKNVQCASRCRPLRRRPSKRSCCASTVPAPPARSAPRASAA